MADESQSPSNVEKPAEPLKDANAEAVPAENGASNEKKRRPRARKPRPQKPSETTGTGEAAEITGTAVSAKAANAKKMRNKEAPGPSKEKEHAAQEAGDKKESTCDEAEDKKRKAVKKRAKKPKELENTTTIKKQPLSAEGAAMLTEIKKRSSNAKDSGVKTGKIAVSELMGGNETCPELGRLRLGNLNPQSLLNTAINQMPQLPGFPSLTHLPDPSPYSSSFRPQLFKTCMEAYKTSPALHCPDEGSGFGSPLGRRSNRVTPSPDQLLPWISFAPMFPIDSNGGRTPERAGNHNLLRSAGAGLGVKSGTSIPGMRSTAQQGAGVPYRSNGVSTPYNNSGAHGYNGALNGGVRPSPSNHSQMGMQKTRKPFFMPYLSHDAVTRGLSNKELIKGSLRVNQRNYEESYIDNPDGDDQLDLLILGIHDRNRALQGDIVVVRLKNREEWVVRESLYQAWRKGQLKTARDDDGQPISIPPLPQVVPPLQVELLDLMMASGSLELTELSTAIASAEDCVYSRKEMLILGKQCLEGMEDVIPSGSGQLSNHLECLISNLGISKTSTEAASPVGGTPGRQPRRPRIQGVVANRRSNYKLLCEMPDDDWGMPDLCLQKTAEVVYIAEAKNCRAAMGQLKMMADGNRNWALFSPTDSRMPRMLIPHEQLPIGFFERPHDYARFIFVARMDEWQATAQFARGKLERTLGEAGDIEAETEGLLFANDVDTREFSHAALSSLPISDSAKWEIDEKEFKYRKDLRKTTIFTIDPSTARDLDDALSIEACDDIDGQGTPGWEVGVHIADVTHFVVENTELDKWAAERATSVYLAHKVVPMLPRILCEELCSLNSGVDRLAFSVIWKMDREANVKDQWFGRTIIRSCCKLSYEHAQDFIDHPNKDFSEAELPAISDGKSPADIKTKVLLLNEVAGFLKKGRQENGALRLDQPKLKFVLDDDTKMPYGVCIYERKDSNSLVEELMLLANASVAEHIENAFPSIAVLRRHPPPKQKVMREVLEVCAGIGFPLDATSSKMLSSALRKFEGNTNVQTAINQVLSSFLMKPMQLAQYFCTGTVNSKAEYHHYALNMPFYTHFTSPIRRYADMMVHRLLAAALGYHPAPSLPTADVEKQAQHCNDKKNAAKTVSEMSDETFFGLFVKQCGPLCERGVVINVLDAAFDVLILKYGVVKRVYVNRLDMAREPLFEGTPPVLTLFWNPGSGKANTPIEQTISLCTVVDVCLSALPEPTKYQATIKMRPKGETKYLQDLMDETI